MEISSTGREEVSLSLVDDGDETLACYFSRLRLLCSEVISLVQNPRGNGEPLVALADFIRTSSAGHLQSCFDYILVPLLMLLDGVTSCRKEVAGPEEKHSLANNGPHLVRDNVAESLFFCLQELLKRCHQSCVDQMVMVLRKLASAAMLSPFQTAEEFRWGIIKCLKALLLRLSPCSVATCSCKLAPGLPFLPSNTEFEVQDEHSVSHPVECLISFLQSQDAFAIVGHWLSLLLQLAETEASRGHHGSAELRTEALLTLRVLIAKVGTADRLAFFLPGVVSRFAKALNISKAMISGAAGSTESMAHVIYGLGELLVITFGDEVNLYGLGMSLEDLKDSHVKNNQSAQLVLETLRHLPTASEETNITNASTNNFASASNLLNIEMREKISDKSPFVDRNKDWIDKTSECVDKLLSATFSHLCVNPAKKVRLALVSCINGLLTKCTNTMKKTKVMLLECLYVLVCDDSTTVASAAQEYIEILMLDNKYLGEHEIAKTLKSLIRQLPKVILGSEDTVAVSHAQKLLAAIYYAGPQRVVDHILCSPVSASQFLDSLSLSVGHNSVFAGSFGKLMFAKPSPAGYLQSLAELTDVGYSNSSHPTPNILPTISSIPSPLGTRVGNQTEMVYPENKLPRMPPWFSRCGAQKLYKAVSGILRLVSVSLIIDCREEVLLSNIIEIPLENLRRLIFELRQKDYKNVSWHSWYLGNGSGRLLRGASSAVCVVNEIMYGISDQSLSLCIDMFAKSKRKLAAKQWHRKVEAAQSIGTEKMLAKSTVQQYVNWKNQAIDCIGNILHEYLSQEIWSLPVDRSSLNKITSGNLNSYFFLDTSMLQQVIIDGLGIFSMSLEKDFKRSGFLLDCLYLLLEKLICSNDKIKCAADAVLHRFSTSLGHKNVRDLVVENADYIVDSLCRQLRHLDLNPQVPNVITAVLSYIGMAHDILPLLDEPMRSVSSELEVLGRHQHPELTISLLKAVREIAKASKQESDVISVEIQTHSALVRAEKHDLEKKAKVHAETGVLSDNLNNDMSGRWEDMLFKLNELKMYRRTIGSVAGSCLAAAGPLLASVRDAACLIVLDIVESRSLKFFNNLKQKLEADNNINASLVYYKRCERGFCFFCKRCSIYWKLSSINCEDKLWESKISIILLGKMMKYCILDGENPVVDIYLCSILLLRFVVE
ncbi:unnamed protein product [Victoria cruziana]